MSYKVGFKVWSEILAAEKRTLKRMLGGSEKPVSMLFRTCRAAVVDTEHIDALVTRLHYALSRILSLSADSGPSCDGELA